MAALAQIHSVPVGLDAGTNSPAASGVTSPGSRNTYNCEHPEWYLQTFEEALVQLRRTAPLWDEERIQLVARRSWDAFQVSKAEAEAAYTGSSRRPIITPRGHHQKVGLPEVVVRLKASP
jgi:hypothetical protein